MILKERMKLLHRLASVGSILLSHTIAIPAAHAFCTCLSHYTEAPAIILFYFFFKLNAAFRK